ncbi:hypothetical protein [Paenibacillus campi]|uniref:hypothetical protein n=1 Tax=Paenibacillus campi TaxID=3106031 RepID=UPI002AFEE96A|nr:hypothetical protein [Paenibacillus sp. SGZ-1014]
MENVDKQITFETARKIAEKAAKKRLKDYATEEALFLSDTFKETKYCWFFFRNNSIVGPPEEVLSWDCAYAVSKKGELNVIGDFSDDPIKLEDYLQKMSNYFKERGL